MNGPKIPDHLMGYLRQWSLQYGTGDVVSDVLTVSIALALLALFLGIISYKRSVQVRLPANYRKVGNLVNRVEQMEIILSEIRSDLSRFTEQNKGDIGYLKLEVQELRRLISGGEGPTGSGGGFGGEPRSGSGERDLTAAPDFDEQEFQPVEPAAETFEQEEVVVGTPEKPQTLGERLKSSRKNFFEKIRSVFVSKAQLDPAMIDDLEVLLITSDLGVKMVDSLLEQVRQEVASGTEVTEEGLVQMLKDRMVLSLERQAPADPKIAPKPVSDGPLVVLVVGVNGVGKTTSIAKLANSWKEEGAKVMLAAADTFRAAAVEQLSLWGQRVGVPVITGAPDAKPSTVVYDAMLEAKRQQVDVLLIDTAGRLHTKSNLMQELEGIRNIIARHQPSAPHETILVVDGTTGQNAINQAKEFNAAARITGVIVTKLDGTAKGGVVVAIKDELNIPIRYIGVGESWSDLKPFNARDFVNALFEGKEEGTQENLLSAHAQTRRRRRREVEAFL